MNRDFELGRSFTLITQPKPEEKIGNAIMRKFTDKCKIKH